MSGHMRISWFLTPSTEAAWHPVDGYPADMVVVLDLDDTNFTIHLNASDADVAERVGAAFIEAATKAREARAAEVTA
jgi:hypothetical protein